MGGAGISIKKISDYIFDGNKNFDNSRQVWNNFFAQYNNKVGLFTNRARGKGEEVAHDSVATTANELHRRFYGEIGGSSCVGGFR
jgi:hypothetical protein